MMSRRFTVDITGQRFGRWLVIEQSGHKGIKLSWKCKCDCGAERNIGGTELRAGKSKSCGCLQQESVFERKCI
jgi:hypothetical protein